VIERDILTHVGAQVLKKDVLKKNAFVVRCLQFTTFVERTFCTETEKEREEWMAAITKISDALKKKGDNLAQQKSNGTNEKQDKEVAKVCMFYVCTYVNSMCVRM
jgi:hypothetical protein